LQYIVAVELHRHVRAVTQLTLHRGTVTQGGGEGHPVHADIFGVLRPVLRCPHAQCTGKGLPVAGRQKGAAVGQRHADVAAQLPGEAGIGVVAAADGTHVGEAAVVVGGEHAEFGI